MGVYARVCVVYMSACVNGNVCMCVESKWRYSFVT